jgi:transposase-like protein
MVLILIVSCLQKECAEALRRVRWASGVRCVYCGSRSVVGRGWRKGLYRRYYCKDCGRWFNDRTGTVFANSKLPLRVWFFTEREKLGVERFL